MAEEAGVGLDQGLLAGLDLDADQGVAGEGAGLSFSQCVAA
jgi:hypothetical protein